MLVEALALLRHAGYTKVGLRVAGPIPDSTMWAPLARLAARRGVDKYIAWLGPQAASGLIRELQNANLYVLPSHIENQPNSLLEAMLLGVPCIAASVGGVPELVGHGVSGLVYHDSDPFALAAAIARLLDEPDYARSLGEAARYAGTNPLRSSVCGPQDGGDLPPGARFSGGCRPCGCTR